MFVLRLFQVAIPTALPRIYSWILMKFLRFQHRTHPSLEFLPAPHRGHYLSLSPYHILPSPSPTTPGTPSSQQPICFPPRRSKQAVWPCFGSSSRGLAPPSRHLRGSGSERSRRRPATRKPRSSWAPALPGRPWTTPPVVSATRSSWTSRQTPRRERNGSGLRCSGEGLRVAGGWKLSYRRFYRTGRVKE